jgi:hypothetical protein
MSTEGFCNSTEGFYTITGKTDGFGSQYLAIMSGIAYCNHHHLIYVHTPVSSMEHDVDVDSLNTFIGINNDHLKQQNLMPSETDQVNSEQYSGLVHFSPRPSIYYTEDVIRTIRNFYYSTEKPRVDELDIAVHIRRGDVTEGNIRYTDNAFYVKLFQALKQKYPTYSITVFSEGQYEDFKEFRLDKSQYKLNTDVRESYHSLVRAKVLVMSKSDFSYTGGLLNENTVYYIDFWHKPLDHWIYIEDTNNNNIKI